MRKRIAAAVDETDAATPLRRVRLTRQTTGLETENEAAEAVTGFSVSEDEHVATAREYGDNNRISDRA